MLDILLQSHYSHFDTLAKSWFAMGATSIGIYRQGRLLASWPAETDDRLTTVAADIPVWDEVIGELRVSGVYGTDVQMRLNADAEVIARIATLESELQSLTVELLISQSQQLSLYRLMEALRSLVTIEETLQVLVHEALRMVKAQGCFVAFVSPKCESLLIQHPHNVLDETIAWRCYWSVSQAEHELILPDGDIAEWEDIPVESLILLPVRVRGTVMAGLGFVNSSSGAFYAPDIKLVRAITDQVSMQIEKVLLYQESFEQAKFRTEMELARRVQIDLLPRHVPHVDGLDIYAHSLPAYQVGGDFYDFIYEKDRPFIFSVGDVTGKGFSAAMLMTMTRTAIHSKALFMPHPTPEVIMRQSHEDLYTDFTQVGVFATAFVGQYDRGMQKILYANAGHYPVIYRPREASADLLRADITAMGVFAVISSKNQSLRMRPGDLLIIATDGFSDARNPNEEMFGYEALLQLVDRLSARSAKEIGEALFDAVEQFGAGRPQDDDQTIMVIKGIAT